MAEENVTPTIDETQPPVEATQPVVQPDPTAIMRQQLEEERRLRTEAQNALKMKEEEALRKSKNWEELAKLKETEAATALKKYEMLQETIIQNEKLSALKTECMKLGINPSALSDLDLMVDKYSISVEATSTGSIRVHGADSAAQLLKAHRPFWFTAKPASVNPSSPGVIPTADQPMTIEALKKLEVEMTKNPTRENQEKYKAGILQFKQRKA